MDYPFFLDGVRRAHANYGSDNAILKGKMVSINPKRIEFKQRIPIQEAIFKHHPEIPLHIDFCFINGHPYFMTINGKVNYKTIRQCRGQGRKEIMNWLQSIVALNTKRGFQLNEYHEDNEFKKI